MQVNTQSNLEHALLYCIEVNLPAHRVGQLNRILVLASPVNDINMFAWDLNRVLCFVESDVGIRMQLCRTCMGPQDTTITFMLSKQFIRPCLAFLCREAHITEPPVSEHGAFVYNLNHVCGFTPPPAVPAPPPPQDLPAPSAKSPTLREATIATKDPAVPPGFGPRSSGIPSPLSKPPPPPPQPSSAPVGGSRHHHDRPAPLLPLSLAEDSGTGGSSSYFYFSPKDSDAIGFFGPEVPPRTIPRKGYECALPAVAQPYSNCANWAWLSQQMYFEGPYQISSRVIITDTGTVVHEPNVLGNKSIAGGHAFGRPNMPLPPRRPQAQSTRHHTVEFQTAHTIAFGDSPAVPPHLPAKSVRKSPSYPPAAVTTKRPSQLGTCQEGQVEDDEDEYIVVPLMASVIAKKSKPPPPLPSVTERAPEPAASGPLRDEVATMAVRSSVEVAVAVDISHTTTYSHEQRSPHSPPRESSPPQEEPHRVPSHLRKQEARTSEDGISNWAPPLPPKVITRGDDQAGLLDFEKVLVTPKPVPKPRSVTRTQALRTSISVNVVSES